jgi:DNA polymerase-3 subunit epsilon
MKRILWVDTETTGTDPKVHGIVQIAAMVEIEGEIVDNFNVLIQPVKGKLINKEALDVHGYTIDDIRTFTKPQEAFNQFYLFLARNNPEPIKAKTNRYIMGGKNMKFDCDFLSQWFFDITGGPYKYWDYCQFKGFDISSVLDAMVFAGILPLKDTTLGTVCEHFGIPLKAHDAMSDIMATRELTHLIYGRLFSGYKNEPWGLLGKRDLTDKDAVCFVCRGSGEGLADNTICAICGGQGVVVAKAG